MSAVLPVFLTAYDPAELPGGTVDPLGFTAGYLALADALFPGMTAAAGQATYFPMLCAGLTLAGTDGALGSLAADAARKRRIEVALRFERLWALASALHSAAVSASVADGAGDEGDEGAEAREGDSGGSRVQGLRGITYVQREAQRLTQARATKAGTGFALLAQQYRYGALGIYGAVASALRLLDKSTLLPTPGFGDAIGESFLETTTTRSARKELEAAALNESATVRLDTLRSWGESASPGVELEGDARELLREAFLHDARRARMLALLDEVTREGPDEWSDTELIRAGLAALSADQEPELDSALEAALAYDAFLRSVTLVFERVLWLCRTQNDAEKCGRVFADPVIEAAARELPGRSRELLEAFRRRLGLGRDELFTRGRGILKVAELLAQAHEGVNSPESVVRAVLRRHAEIQSGKFEQGRPKLAWIEERGAEFVLTGARIGTRVSEPTSPDEIRAPDWRFGAALNFLNAVGGLPNEASA